ncbi:hypothetical protein EC988_009389, partial [Linderina pennispora]
QRHKIQPVNIPPKPKWRDNNPVNTLLLARNPVILAIIFHNSMIFGCYILFLIGFSMTWQLSNTSNYLVDLYATRSASITASQSFFRSIWSGICTQIIITIKDGVGWGWEFTIFGGLAAISGAITLLISFNGEQIRRRFPIDPSK